MKPIRVRIWNPDGGLGKPVVRDGWTFAVASAEERDLTVANEAILPRGAFRIVALEATNTGDEPAMLPWRDLRIEGAEGRLYGPDKVATRAYHAYVLGSSAGDDLQR